VKEKLTRYLKERKELLARVTQEIAEIEAAIAFVDLHPGAGYLAVLEAKLKSVPPERTT
jgi:ABC-type Zn uptake system ZnuABC Zn-binding protein ZnuA